MPRSKQNNRGNSNGNTGDEKDNGKKQGEQKSSYESIVKQNEHFEKYYKQLKNLIEENEYDLFLETLKIPLPITFRITSYKSFSREVLNMLKEEHFKYIDEITKGKDSDKVMDASANKGASLLKYSKVDGDEKRSIDPDEEIYKCLKWYPNELAWQVSLSKQDVKKNIHFEQFKQFLIHQTENGNCSRQEAVSMIPPLLLDIQPHHKILDMCASPGSKTAQLIEFLHNSEDPCPDGYVIANDLDNKRCYMLMHQLKRLESPNFMIINQDASNLPNFRSESDPNKNILFDRILADVPCSGDGTLRKNIDVWKKWKFSHACNLHGIQSRIARRGIELLEEGGIMVYSTCSLNPVENEAVVYNLLLKYKNLELIDARDKLPHLKTVKGLLTWNLMDKNGELYNNTEEVRPEYANLMRSYMFPPSLEVAKELNLDKCIRILPHHQDTGGFFIAVIRKLPANNNINSQLTNEENNDEKLAQAPKKDTEMKAPAAKRLKHMFQENPFQFIDSNNQLLNDWSRIKEFFQISDEFPLNQMMTRNRKGENVKNVYFVSKQIRELTLNNGDRFKFINMGVPLFSKAEIKDATSIDLRICQESLDIILKYFKKRIVYINKRLDLFKILTESMPSLNELSADLQAQIKEQSDGGQCGSLILSTKSINLDEELKKLLYKNQNDLSISFTAWLGKTTLRPLINVNARGFFLSICGVDKVTISKFCDKIKSEDKINSQKSLETNPQYKAKMNLTSASTNVIDEKEVCDNNTDLIDNENND